MTTWILASLCHASYSVTSFVLNLISPEERKALMVKNVDDPVIQVLLLRFNFSLTRANLSSQLQDNVGHYVSQMLDAVCHTYGEEDCLLLQIYCDFLKDLGTEPRHREDLQRSISLEFIQQVFLVLDYSEGCNRANELIFRFAREAVSFYAGDIHSLLDLIVRTISARLESNISSAKPASVPDCYEAIMLLEFMLRTVKMQIEEAPEEMSTSQTQNVKLLLEQIVPVLCDIFAKDPMDRNSASDIDAVDQLARTTHTYTAILVTMSTIGEKEDWVDVICKQLKNPPKLIQQIKSITECENSATLRQSNSFDPRYTLHAKCFIPMISELIHLCVILAAKTQQTVWTMACQNLIADDGVVGDIDACMKKGCHTEEIGTLLLSLAEGKLTNIFTNALTTRNKRMTNASSNNVNESYTHSVENGISMELTNENCSQILSQNQADVEIGELMENVRKAVTNLQIDDCLPDIFDLNEYRLIAHKRQMQSLKVSLKAADQRITETGLINVHLESENTKLNNITKNLLRKLETTAKELSEIKAQYRGAEEENTEFRQSLLREVDSKTTTIGSLEEERAKVIGKVHRYKEKLGAMQKAIEEYQQTQANMQEKLKEEAKQKSDLQSTLTKREEKLKKKDCQLQEQRGLRETQDK